MIAGVDEAGRGCLAGPVYAAAVVFVGTAPEGLNDSKKLSPARREQLFDVICAQAADWCIARAEVEEIDRVNILQATFLAMQRAVAGLRSAPREVWIDGNQSPRLPQPIRMIVGGDALEPAIMAASILAKVARDRELVRLDAEFPAYGFAQHKGYGTPEHLAALQRVGPSAQHRMSFAPCAQASFGFAAPAGGAP